MGSALKMRDIVVRHAHLFGGLGGGALGFQRAHVRVGRARADMRCLGSIDVDAAACRDFSRLVGVPATCLDLFDRQQYEDWYGHAPGDGWREVVPEDIRTAFGHERPDIVFTSPPCKGFSGLLNPKSANSQRYQALNRLTVRGIQLLLDAYDGDPIPFILLENVPRIATRGRALLDQIRELLCARGYAVTEPGVHDCGELGGLAQHRRRYLLVARHRERVPPFLYQPATRPVRSVGEVLGTLPLPDAASAGPMHRLPRLQWRTWVRLALIEAGGDWRSLHKLEVAEDGYLRDLALLPAGTDWHTGVMGVRGWDQPSGTVTGSAAPARGSFSVADPRSPSGWAGAGKYQVTPWGQPSGTVIGASTTGNGAFSVADPRCPNWRSERTGRVSAYRQYGVIRWADVGHTVTSQAAPGAGPYSVADPRMDCDANDRQRRRFNNVLRVVRWSDVGRCVTGATGAMQAIADPRPWKEGKTSFQSGGHYGVLPWDEPAGTITGHAKHDRGRFSVADRRVAYGPKDRPDPAPWIISLDGTRHRPLTTLELAALQGFDAELLVGGLDGRADSRHRERIGNAVPPPAAQAIAEAMAETLMLAAAGDTFRLDARPIWVQPYAAAVSIDVPAIQLSTGGGPR